MTPEQAGNYVTSKVSVTREDIARAKSWIVRAPGSNVSGMADEWLSEQNIPDIRHVNTDAQDCEDILTNVAHSYSVRLAFFTAVWELINAGAIVASELPGLWQPSLEYKTSHNAGGIPVASLAFPHPSKIVRLPFSNERADADIFLKGIDCTTLHSGIVEAIEQSLTCFRRGLYMPATVMLAAAAEATWMECGRAVATHFSDPKLTTVMNDPFVSIAKVVSELRKALEHKNAKPLLQKARLTIHQVTDAEIWTTALRDRRNALHWGKAKSFISGHAETGTLLMAAPQHLGTLESIRAGC